MDQGYDVVALDGGGRYAIGEIAQKQFEKLVLVIGGEDKSVGQYILNHASYVMRIAQQGRINSLNASVAAGIALFAFARSR